jgi:hypothetical protein
MKPASPSVYIVYLPDSSTHHLRLLLREAMLHLQLLPSWKEHIPGKGKPPFPLAEDQAFPALYVNGQLVWNASHAGMRPSAEQLEYLLKNPPKNKPRWIGALRHHLSFLMAVFIAFFPKCPFCWAAYMSLLTALGLKTIPYQPWLLPLFIVLLFLNLVSLFFSRKRHGNGPLLISLTGALLITLNRLYVESISLLIIGACLLVIASLWNSLSPRMLRSLRYYVKFLTFRNQT